MHSARFIILSTYLKKFLTIYLFYFAIFAALLYNYIMKQYFFLIQIVFFLLFGASSSAQTNFLEINKSDNSVFRVEINTLHRITFSGTDMNIRLKSGETTTLGTTAIRSMIFRTSTAVPGLNAQGRIALFPNPATEFICINQPLNDEKDIVILSLTGQQLVQQKIQSRDDRIQIGHLIPGVYILQIDNQFVKFTKR